MKNMKKKTNAKKMSNARKIFSLLLALMMVLSMGAAMGTIAYARDVATEQGGSASITINNAAKNETYSIYKLFDAAVGSADEYPIAYTGNIPESLASYFSKDSAGNISATAAAGTSGDASSDLIGALKLWAKSQTAIKSQVSDGSKLTFTGLKYGYYVVTSTQGEGAAITVDSTKPNATISDKNTTAPIKGLKKEADAESYSIGDTVTYTVTFETANYTAAGKQIVSYAVKDTLPDFLSDVNVTKITVGGAAVTTQQFDKTTKSFTIPWANNGTSIYANGAKVIITYTAKLTDKAAIAGSGNQNKITITYKDADGNAADEETTEIIYTYALAVKKIDGATGKALTGAKFTVKGLKTTGSNGTYTVTSCSANENNPTEMEVGSDGVLLIKGLKAGNYEVTETSSPAGYNKLTESKTVTVTAAQTGATTTSVTKYLENGNVVDESTSSSSISVGYTNNSLAASVAFVINNAGTELPSTGGIGTTIFYIIGGLLVIGALVFFIVRRRMSTEE